MMSLKSLYSPISNTMVFHKTTHIKTEKAAIPSARTIFSRRLMHGESQTSGSEKGPKTAKVNTTIHTGR